MPPLALIFDLDGTLIDSAPDIHATANAVFGVHGFPPVTLALVRSFIGNGVGVLVSRLLQHHGHASPLPGAQSDPLHGDLVAEFITRYETAFALTRLYPGVGQALQQLALAAHPLGLCTNKPLGPTRAALRHFGLEPYLRVVIGGDSLALRKPHPAPLHAALAGLGVQTGLFIGDSEVDAETALAASVPFALFTEGYRKAPPDTLGASLIFDDFAHFPDLVAQFTAGL